MPALTVAVTLQDLEKAIGDVSGRHQPHSQCCLLAHALRRTTGCEASVGSIRAYVHSESLAIFEVPRDARRLANQFDNEQYDELRSLLQHPQVFAFEVKE
jgi:hypothetical protein